MPTAAVKPTKRMTLLSNGGMAVSADFKNTIVQTLDATIPKPDKPEEDVYYSKEAFQKAVDEGMMDNTKIILTDGIHPFNFELFERDPEEAMRQIGAEDAGVLLDPRVELEGQPRLMGNFHLTNPKAVDLWKAGNLSLSTGLNCLTTPNGEVKGRDDISEITDFNHIIVFPRDKANPRDKGTFILNSEPVGEDVTDENNKAKAALIALWNTMFPKESPPAEPEKKVAAGNSEEQSMVSEKELQDARDAAKALELKNSDLEKTVKEQGQKLETLGKQVETLTATNSEYKNAEDKRKQAERDATWLELKNSLPKGLTATPADEKALRDEAEGDPLAFSKRLTALKIQNSTQKQGSGTGGNDEGDGKDYASISDRFRRATGQSVEVKK